MIWSQRWSDVLFLHFAVQPAKLIPHIPRHLELDIFAGRAWISFVLFRLKLRPAGLPFIAGVSSLNELNLRTYVRHRGNPGICFLSMHADNWLAIRAAQLLTPLRYQAAEFNYATSCNGERRIECRAVGDPCRRLIADFRPAGPLAAAATGSMDAWLLERYRLFVGVKNGMIAADVEHLPWQYTPVQTTVTEATIAEPFGLALGQTADASHYSPGLTARFGAFRQVASSLDIMPVPAGLQARATGLHGGR